MYFLCLFSGFSQGQKTRGAEVFLLLVCEWVGGVLHGEESSIDVNPGKASLFAPYTYEVSKVHFFEVHKVEIQAWLL